MTLKIKFLILIILGYTYYTFAQKPKEIQAVVDKAFAEFNSVNEGKNADYIKELAKVDPKIYGIVVVDRNGKIYTAGDIKSQVSIQSVSKAFVLAMVINQSGAEDIREKVGVNATGFAFNSILAMEFNRNTGLNSMVNAGAIATTSLVNGNTANEKWENIQNTLSDFAGRKLSLDEEVYISEAGDNQRNVAKAMLLKSYDRIYFDPIQSVDIYTKQCALRVNTYDLAVMAATLANGGINPITNKTVVSPEAVANTLSVMATAGLYENSGTWLYKTGLPAKSGVGGALIAVVPGKFGIAVVSPPLDNAGNSVKGQLAIQYIVEQLKLNPYLINLPK
jgi:glutaminase